MNKGRLGERRVTLADVAREAGVSLQTVSLVLSGNPETRIPQATMDRVNQAAEKIHYRPNRIAQAMRQGRTNVIAIWVPLSRPNMAILRFLKGFFERSVEDGYHLMIVGVEDAMAYSAAGKRPRPWPADAVIAVDSGKAIQTFRDDPANDGTPVAVLGLEEYANADCTSYANAAGARSIGERLIQSGCRNLLFVGVDWVVRDYPREQRRRGFREAAEVGGVAISILSASGETSTAAEQAVKRYLEGGGTADGVFAFNDSMAIGAARAFLERGARIPEDVQIVGYGDNPEAADFSIPLTTLRVPIEKIVETAWGRLLERISNPLLPTRVVEMPLEIVERASTRFLSA